MNFKLEYERNERVSFKVDIVLVGKMEKVTPWKEYLSGIMSKYKLDNAKIEERKRIFG